MVGVGQNDGGIHVVGEVPRRQAFDGGLRAHGHKDRRRDHAVGSVEVAGARPGLGADGFYFESQATSLGLAGVRSQALSVQRGRRTTNAAPTRAPYSAQAAHLEMRLVAATVTRGAHRSGPPKFGHRRPPPTGHADRNLPNAPGTVPSLFVRHVGRSGSGSGSAMGMGPRPDSRRDSSRDFPSFDASQPAAGQSATPSSPCPATRWASIRCGPKADREEMDRPVSGKNEQPHAGARADDRDDGPYVFPRGTNRHRRTPSGRPKYRQLAKAPVR